jgi:voltage-gated potassium channel Kch
MKSLARSLLDLHHHAWERFLGFAHRRTLFTFIMAVLVILSISAAVFRVVENDNREPIWRSIVYITSGMDVDPPQTTAGQVAAAMILISGIVLVSLLTGYVASEFARVMVSAHAVRPKPRSRVFENHVIIFGWSSKTKAILRELNSDYAARGIRAEDIIIVSEEAHLERGREPIYNRVWHVQGPATDPDVLAHTDLAPVEGRKTGARVAVILSDARLEALEADRRSLLTVLAIEHLHPPVISLVEVRADEDEQHFVNANSDDVVLPDQYANLMLARTAEHPGLAAYVDELLALAPVDQGSKAKPGVNPVSFYVRSAGELEVVGLPLGEAVTACYSRYGVIIAGLLGAGGIELFCDQAGTPARKVGAEQKLVCIARPERIARI